MQIKRAEEQYLDNLCYIYDNGKDLKNERTGETCRTVINIDQTYDATSNKAPLLTTRQIVNPNLAIAELLGYIKGVSSAAQFRELGTKSWDANANTNPAWLANENRRGVDDVGIIYGGVAKNWPVFTRHTFGEKADNKIYHVSSMDLFHKVYDNLKKGVDDRGEIITFWNPGMFKLGALRPCMYEHQFSLIGEDLYLNSTQRSNDWPLGCTANMLQVWLFLRLMAQITNKNPMYAFHRSVNAHIYGNQLELVPEQLKRDILTEPTIDINPEIKTLQDVETWVTVNDFKVTYPEYHPPIKYPFSV